MKETKTMILVDGEELVLNLNPTKAVNNDEWTEA